MIFRQYRSGLLRGGRERSVVDYQQQSVQRSRLFTIRFGPLHQAQSIRDRREKRAAQRGTFSATLQFSAFLLIPLFGRRVSLENLRDLISSCLIARRRRVFGPGIRKRGNAGQQHWQKRFKTSSDTR